MRAGAGAEQPTDCSLGPTETSDGRNSIMEITQSERRSAIDSFGREMGMGEKQDGNSERVRARNTPFFGINNPDQIVTNLSSLASCFCRG